MKTTAALLLLFLANICISQTPWPESGTKWWYFGGDALYGPRQLILEAVGEEVYKGQLCQKIEQTHVDFNGNASPSDSFYAYLKNDSVFFYSDVWEEFILIFDYTAELGDTIILKNPNTKTGQDSTFHCNVNKIDTVEYCNGDLKVKSWSIEHTHGYADYLEVVMQSSFLHPFDLYTWYGFDDADKYLHCFYDGSNDLDCEIFNSGEDEPCYGRPSKVKEGEVNDNILLFPNPAIDKLWIQFPREINQIHFQITDLAGKVLKRDYLSAGRREIGIEELSAGTYFISFPTLNDRCQKFVVIY